MNGRIVHRVMEYSTSLITITVESFLIAHEVISAEYSAERLQCPASVGKCAGASHAYTWDHMVVPPCPWKLAHSTHGTLLCFSPALLFLACAHHYNCLPFSMFSP